MLYSILFVNTSEKHSNLHFTLGYPTALRGTQVWGAGAWKQSSARPRTGNVNHGDI